MDNIIFLISQPRAGSTMLQIQLAKHREIETLAEPWLLLPLLGMHKEEFVSGIYNHNLFLRTQKDFLANLGQEAFDKHLADFTHGVYGELAKEKKYFLDKTPRYYEILPEMVRVFPNAKFIVLKRHPINVLKSVIETWCRRTIKNIQAYARDLIVAPFLIQDFVRNAKCEIIEVRYEDLLADPEVTMEKLLDFLELDMGDVLEKKVELLGEFGDQTRARTVSDISGANPGWEDLNTIENPTYRRLANRYTAFLSDDFLSEYGNYGVQSKNNSAKGQSFFNKLVAKANSTVNH